MSGVVVRASHRRRGVASALTGARVTHIAASNDRAYYVANVRNEASIALHDKFGFKELTRDFSMPNLRFAGGAGILFCADLRKSVF